MKIGSNDTIFLNADYIVIEYHDMLRSPYLVLLALINQNKKIREVLKLEQLDGLDDLGIYEWYVNRKHQNFFLDLNRYPDQISEKRMDELLEEQVSYNKIFYEFANDLLLMPLLINRHLSKLCRDVIIYDKHNNNFAYETLNTITNKSFTVKHDIDEIIDLCKSNSTYFFSDIKNIYRLRDKNYLKYSSVTIPVEYRYNKKNLKDFDMDFDELFRKNPFKLSYTRACSLDKAVHEVNQMMQGE